MTTLQEAAQQLIDFHDGPAEAKRHDVFIRRIESIRAALAQQGQEPVAYMDNDGNISDNNDHGTFNTPLYAAPAPQAQPVAQPTDHSEQHLDMVAQPLRELSDEEIREMADCIVANLDGRKGVINLDLDDDLIEEIMQEMCDTIKSAVLKKASE